MASAETRAAQAIFRVQAPTSEARVSDGWGIHATVGGRAIDLASYDWTDDPQAQPNDVEAGYGWRRGGARVLVGFDQHDFGPTQQPDAPPRERDPNVPPPVSSAGVLGLSFVLHGR